MTSEPTPVQRVLVVDDHEIVRLGIRQLIATASDLMVCGEAATAEHALALTRTVQPDLAIVDLSLDTTPGLVLVRQLHDAAPEMPILVLSMHDEGLFAERALRAGARGYIMKKRAIVGLVHAIREVLAGRLYASESVLQGLLRGLGENILPSSDPLTALTDRELEVFVMIGQGATTASIADNLKLSVKTIETYRSNIKLKLNLKDATNLIRFAVSRTLQL